MSNIEQVIIRTPEQLAFRNPEAITTVAEIRTWLETLPLLKPVPTVQQLTNAIDTINRQPLPTKKRLPLLQEYRQVILQLNPSLNLLALKRLSLPAQDLESLKQQMIELCTALADGYKVIIKESLENGNAQAPGALFEPLYYALEALALAVLNSFRTYQDIPQNLYEDIHQLYLLAEHTAVTERDIMPDKLSLCAGSIGLLYKQVMIMSYLDPYHWPVGIAEKLFERLSRLSSHCQLLQQPQSNTETVFITDLASDEAPRSLSRVADVGAVKILRIFDLQVMTAEIQSEISRIEKEEHGLSVESETALLNRLIVAGKNRTRGAERTDCNKICKICFGIDAVHYFLNINKQELEQVLESTADRFGPHLLESWTITNESQSGLSLQNESISLQDVRVGDIIGLLSKETTTEDKQETIGVIRWIKNDKKSNVSIGVEFINGNPLAAMCYLIDGPQTNNTFAAIFVSSQALNDSPATLITPKKVYQRDRVIEVTIGNQPLRIKAGFLRDDTFTFDRFDFTSINN